MRSPAGVVGRAVGDARHLQIAVLAVLLALNLAWVDFGARPLPSLVGIGACLVGQALCHRLWRTPALEVRSALITGLSLALLLRGDALWVPAAAGLLAMASKHAVRIRGKHLWNPSAVAIGAMVFGTDHAWVSPGQWGTALWLAALLSLLAIVVLAAASRADISLAFLGSYAGLLVWRAIQLGDPLTIPLHQLQNGSLLLFAFYMISDPRTVPDARIARLIFAATVAGLAYWLAFHDQIRPALYAALIVLSPLSPLLDRAFPAPRFQWSTPRPA